MQAGTVVKFVQRLTGYVVGADSAGPEVTIAGYPYIGTDESGKGDYFGPLVVAGVALDERRSAILDELGVIDSKKLKAPAIRELARQIREVCPGAFKVVTITPIKYNELYRQFREEGKNLNSLLAWGHARVLEDLALDCKCKQAITDKFGDERYIRTRLSRRGIVLDLVQTPKGERFTAVAAASILARETFINYLAQKSKDSGISLPLGASERVIQVAREIHERWGMDGLARIAKLHFKTTRQVSQSPS
ncbi:ribonuclease HIII [bacterium]|nr:ribonuclease HIII [candidate division CSSED10-310 bacterium]